MQNTEDTLVKLLKRLIMLMAKPVHQSAKKTFRMHPPPQSDESLWCFPLLQEHPFRSNHHILA